MEIPDRSEVAVRYVIERTAEERPQDQCAGFLDGDSWTWAKMYRAASALGDLGARRGDFVAVYLPNTLDWFRA